ncbi:hypothetical protein B0H17DRAFT_1212247 [Mycena rosella]|uniref:Uncharacterized protein n=1 Tax=Mycena rosella TaxID=1033263 RepID=A0AAD7CSP5_MYCRO|nr:hypothetical protein B0H17DRAFT_1212247 [Mycena rosella]
MGPQHGVKKLRQERLEELERLRAAPQTKPPPPRKTGNFSASVHTQILPDAKNPANTNPRQNTVAKSRAHPSAISPHHSSDARRPKDGRLREASPDYELLVRDTDTTGFPCFHREADWSDASDEDEFDPDAGLPYCPRWNISSRRANAMVILASRLTKDEWLECEQADLALRQQEQYRKQAENAMVPVAAELILVGALRKSLEREEIGPAPHGFQYIQLEEAVYLTRGGGDGSLVYIASADSVSERLFLNSFLQTTTIMGATGSYKYSPRHHNSHLTKLAPGLGPSSCPICINAVRLPDRSPHHWIGIGHMDGESVERGWALLNQLSSETKEMGAGERRDTLDGMSSSWMWRAEKASKRSKRAKKAAK